MTYHTADDRVFKAERGHATVDLGYEGHGMFGLRLQYDWGKLTSSFYGLDHVVDFAVDVADREKVAEPYMHLLITEILHVFSVDYLSSLRKAECYLLFSENYVAHEAPLGIVNIKDIQNVLIFNDLLEPYRK